MNTKNVSPHASRMSNLADGDNVPVDDRVSQALEEYAAALEKGQPLSREVLLEKYADVAEELAGCLDSLNFIRDIAPQIAEQRPNDDDAAKQQTNQAPVAIGDYRIIRELGRGGMGVVYEAEQLSLGRSVALKVLPYAAMMDHKAITRFKNEARAAATLDHPHIVPVFAVGNERGIYYYAMSLIDGLTVAELVSHLRRSITDPADSSDRLSIDDFLAGPSDSIDNASVSHLEPTVDSGQPTKKGAGVATGHPNETYRDVEAAISTHRSRFDQRYFHSVAGLGAQAAEALDHAHQHGIVHRDIKPGNLMIDRHAKLLVTDFGLARIESDASMTMTGDLIGTLRYMSPEQALAKRIVVDHRADIYALGASLYELLALRPAFDGPSREALLRQIAFEEPKPLRHFNRAVPEDLQTIVHKALSKNPDDRYQTAQAMADDLHAFVDDEPIKARPLSISQRTVKWGTKRKRLVASVAGALIFAVVALSISNTIIVQERDAAREAQTKERAQQLEANRQRKLAEAAVAREKTERARAEGNFQQARATVDTYLTKVSEDELLNQPGMQSLRRDLLELALSYYQQFSVQRSDDPGVQQDLADAHYRVGQIQSELGAAQDSLDSHQQGLKLRETLVGLRPQSTDLRNELAESFQSVARQQLALGKLDQASQSFAKAIAIAQQLVTTHPDQSEYLITLAEGQVGIASLHEHRGEFDEMVANHKKAVEIWEALAGQDKTLREDFALAGIRLAEAYQKRRREVNQVFAWVSIQASQLQRLRSSAESKTVADLAADRSAAQRRNSQAVAILKQLAKEEQTISRQYDLAKAHIRIGRLSNELADYQKAHEILTRLVQANPAVPAFRYTLGVCQSKISVRHRINLSWDKADEAYEDSVSILKQLVETYPEVSEYQRALAASYRSIGFSGGTNVGGSSYTDYRSSGTLDEQVAAYQSALGIYHKLVEAHPDLIEDRKNLGDCYNELGALHRKHGNLDEALVAFQESAQIREQVFNEQPWPKNQYDTGLSSIWVGSILTQLGKSAEARASYQRAVAVLEALLNLERRTAYWNKLVSAYTSLAAIEEKAGNREQALAWFARSVEQTEERFIRIDTYCTELADQLRKLATFQRAAGHFDEARDSCRRAIFLYTYAIELTPNTMPKLLLPFYYSRARLYEDNEQQARARADYRKSAELLLAMPLSLRINKGYWGNLGQFLYKSGQYDEARRAIEKCIKLGKETQPTIKGGPRWLYQTMLLARAGETDLAQSYYDQLSKESEQLTRENEVEAYERFRLEAAQLLGIERAPDVSEESEEPNASDDSDAKTSLEHAEFLAFLKEVIADKEQLIAQKPAKEKPYSDLVYQYGIMARVYSQSGDRTQQVVTLQKAVAFCKERIALATTGVDPDLRLAIFYQRQLGSVYRRLSQTQQDAGRRNDAQASLQLAENSDNTTTSLYLAIPEDERTIADWSFLGQALYQAKQYAEAREAFDKNIELRGETEPTIKLGPRWWYVAMLLAHTGDTEQALAYYQQLVSELETGSELDRANYESYRVDLARLLGIEEESTLPNPKPVIDPQSPEQPPTFSKQPGQVPDLDFEPVVINPEYQGGTGPRVLIDEGHNNMHTRTGRYAPFAKLLLRDGYRVAAHQGRFTAESLAAADVLVIANARSRSPAQAGNSAFDDEEVDSLQKWVQAGGSLLFIADHAPYGAAASELAKRFGIEMTNSYTFEPGKGTPLLFDRDAGLAVHSITDGRSDDERIQRVATFTGQAFRAPEHAVALLVFGEKAFATTVKPGTRFMQNNPQNRIDIAGWLQGAVLREGAGRVAVFGEASMFSAQLAGPERRPIGMNSPLAPQNAQFTLNVLHWLSGSEDKTDEAPTEKSEPPTESKDPNEN